MPEFWQLVLAAAEDAVEGQDERHGGGLLQARTPGDLRGESLAAVGVVSEPLADDRFDIVGVAQRLEFADPMRLVVSSILSWLFHALGLLVSTTLHGCLSESACRSRSRAVLASLASSRESITSKVGSSSVR